MTNISPLNFVYKAGKFGDYNKKSENNLLKVTEVNGLEIFQIVQYKNSSFDISLTRLDGLSFPSPLKSTSNSNTRILWLGPNHWVVFSSVLDLMQKIPSSRWKQQLMRSNVWILEEKFNAHSKC